MAKGKPKKPKGEVVRKTPLSAVSGQSELAPRYVARSSSDQGTLVGRFNELDLRGLWCLSEISKNDHLNLLERIRSVETMTPKEVFTDSEKLGKDYDTADLPTRAARKRAGGSEAR